MAVAEARSLLAEFHQTATPYELMERLSQQVLRRCPEHDPQNCANTMRAHGVPVVGGSPVIAASSKRATEVISEFACQSLANTGWSLTNSSATGDELLSSAEVQVESLISHFDSSDHSEKELLEFSMGLLGFFWAFAFLEVSCELHSRMCTGHTVGSGWHEQAWGGSRSQARCKPGSTRTCSPSYLASSSCTNRRTGRWTARPSMNRKMPQRPLRPWPYQHGCAKSCLRQRTRCCGSRTWTMDFCIAWTCQVQG
eukprot:s1328_g3.t2